MADIQPKNTDSVRFNKITEKTTGVGTSFLTKVLADTLLEYTAGNGVRLNTAFKALATALVPLLSTIDIGTTTLAEHVRAVYAQTFGSSGVASRFGTLTAHDTIIQYLNTAALTLKGLANTSTPAGRLQIRLGDTGFTSGGEMELFTANATTTSVTPVTAFSYTIPQVNTQVTFLVYVQSRDNTAGTMSSFLASISGGRAAGAAVAGSVGSSTAVNGTALGTLTVAASTNDIQIKVQNVSGANTTYHRLLILAIPVSTST